jgi:lysophospholipase L1-like esterase
MAKPSQSKKSSEKGKIDKPASVNKPPKWFYAVPFIIPVIFFILLEVSLRVINYGLDYTQFKVVSDYYPDKLFLNPDIPYKYFFNIKTAPSVLPDGFDKEKKDDAFRVFVIGGSSAAGWPYVPNASFSRQLKRRLELLYPDNTIEVINCGISAINSYTIRDFVPGIIEQKPDLVLIYAGHNEYYGALGAGSAVFFANSRFLVNTFIWLQDFKTTQLLQDLISWFYGLFTGKEKTIEQKSDGTLMSQMIGESLIAFDSDVYWNGIEQFKGNLNDILETFSDNSIPVILGTVTMNLLDQKPFVSVETENHPSAEIIYNDAKRQLELGNIEESQNLFFQAKELDALRFRAPEKINEAIKEYADKYSYPLVDVNSLFKVNSPYNIVGYNLTVDHLHPNIDGYRMIADAYYEKMDELKILPAGKKLEISKEKADSILIANFPFTKLDSTLAEFSIIMLTGAYPFVPQGTPNYKMLNYKMSDIVDSLAAAIKNRDIMWENGHAKLAEHYFNKGDYSGFMREMDAIIAERPFFDVPYENVIVRLIDNELLEESIPYLVKLHSFKPSHFTNKWLGQVYLKLNDAVKSLPYLIEAAKYPEADYRVFYNLAGAYYLTGSLDLALSSIERSLQLNPRNPLAQNLYQQLKAL